MTDYTPGPWKCEGPDWAGDYNISPEDEMLCVAAAVSNMRLKKEVKANAELIASAPRIKEERNELLQLVTEISEFLLPSESISPTAPCFDNEAARVLIRLTKRARVLIAKVEK